MTLVASVSIHMHNNISVNDQKSKYNSLIKASNMVHCNLISPAAKASVSCLTKLKSRKCVEANRPIRKAAFKCLQDPLWW